LTVNGFRQTEVPFANKRMAGSGSARSNAFPPFVQRLSNGIYQFSNDLRQRPHENLTNSPQRGDSGLITMEGMLLDETSKAIAATRGVLSFSLVAAPLCAACTQIGADSLPPFTQRTWPYVDPRGDTRRVAKRPIGSPRAPRRRSRQLAGFGSAILAAFLILLGLLDRWSGHGSDHARAQLAQISRVRQPQGGSALVAYRYRKDEWLGARLNSAAPGHVDRHDTGGARRSRLELLAGTTQQEHVGTGPLGSAPRSRAQAQGGRRRGCRAHASSTRGPPGGPTGRPS
jgi:hypothetical protein